MLIANALEFEIDKNIENEKKSNLHLISITKVIEKKHYFGLSKIYFKHMLLYIDILNKNTKN